MLDFSRSWIPFLYLYGVGGGIFVIGMIIILRSHSLKKERVRHNTWLHVLIFGFLYYMGIHSIFTFLALGETLFAGLIAAVILALIGNLIFIFQKNSKGTG